jgi:hypothetical protein
MKGRKLALLRETVGELPAVDFRSVCDSPRRIDRLLAQRRERKRGSRVSTADVRRRSGQVETLHRRQPIPSVRPHKLAGVTSLVQVDAVSTNPVGPPSSQHGQRGLRNRSQPRPQSGVSMSHKCLLDH